MFRISKFEFRILFFNLHFLPVLQPVLPPHDDLSAGLYAVNDLDMIAFADAGVHLRLDAVRHKR